MESQLSASSSMSVKSYKEKYGDDKKDDIVSSIFNVFLNQSLFNLVSSACNRCKDIFSQNKVDSVCAPVRTTPPPSKNVESPKHPKLPERQASPNHREYEHEGHEGTVEATTDTSLEVDVSLGDTQTSSHISKGRGAKLNNDFSPLMLLLIFSMQFGNAEAAGDRINNVRDVDMHIFCMVMVVKMIGWFLLEYLLNQVRPGMIHSQESDTESPRMTPLSHVYGDRAQHLNPRANGIHSEKSSYSYEADPSFNSGVQSFEGEVTETGTPHLPSEVPVRNDAHHPISPEIVAGNALPHSVEETKKEHISSCQGRDEMIIPQSLAIEISIPCQESDLFSFNAAVGGEPAPQDYDARDIADHHTQSFLDMAVMEYVDDSSDDSDGN